MSFPCFLIRFIALCMKQNLTGFAISVQLNSVITKDHIFLFVKTGKCAQKLSILLREREKGTTITLCRELFPHSSIEKFLPRIVKLGTESTQEHTCQGSRYQAGRLFYYMIRWQTGFSACSEKKSGPKAWASAVRIFPGGREHKTSV